MSAAPLIYLIAGEPSGDILGGRLMRAISAATGGEARFAGVGGPAMTEAGLSSLFPMDELAIMGLAEVVPKIPSLLRRIRETADDIAARKPDAVVTIDAPDFCLRVAKRLRGRGNSPAIPVVHYVAPSVWAWRPGRAAKIARLVDHVMCLLPFEPPYFERVGLRASFVGHPILESGAADGDGAAFRAAAGIPAGAPVLAVLPGSRRGEVARLLPAFGATVHALKQAFPAVHVVIPTLPHVAGAVQAEAGAWPDCHIVLGDHDKYAAFAAADAALAASGTVSLELAMAGVPTVIAYRVAPLTAFIARRLIKVKYASIVNLILDKPVMPEFLQENSTPAQLIPALTNLLSSEDARRARAADIALALAHLRPESGLPSEAAARIVLDQAGFTPKT